MFKLVFGLIALPFTIIGGIGRLASGKVNLRLRHGDVVIDARPFFEEAFRAHPYVDPRHKERLAAIFKQHWDTGVGERVVIKAELPVDFFRNLGDKRPEDAIKPIFMRATFGITRFARKIQEDKLRKAGLFVFNKATCDVNLGYCCAKARSMNGKTVPIKKRTAFPLKGCDADWCSCQWIPLHDRKR